VPNNRPTKGSLRESTKKASTNILTYHHGDEGESFDFTQSAPVKMIRMALDGDATSSNAHVVATAGTTNNNNNNLPVEALHVDLTQETTSHSGIVVDGDLISENDQEAQEEQPLPLIMIPTPSGLVESRI
jgi:archaellum component FlaF (FlaF/FlaG flagellin family)